MCNKVLILCTIELHNMLYHQTPSHALLLVQKKTIKKSSKLKQKKENKCKIK